MKRFFISQVIQLVALLVIFQWSKGDVWFAEKILDFLLLTIVFAITSILNAITFFFRPIKINVSLHNSLDTEEKSTTIHMGYDKMETLQYQRYIDLNIYIHRRSSIWWKVFMYAMKHNKVFLYVVSQPTDLHLQEKNHPMLDDVELNSDNGFNIRLNDLFNNLSNSIGEYPISKKYEFFIVDHPDITIPTAKCIITPHITFERNQGFFSYYIKLFIFNSLLSFTTDQHQVKYYKRG